MADDFVTFKLFVCFACLNITKCNNFSEIEKYIQIL